MTAVERFSEPLGRLSRPLAAGLIGLSALAASAQLSTSSWWPKSQRDLHNSGSATVMSIVRHAHVSWTVRIGDPVALAHYSSPVFSADNSRLYLGGDQSTLVAVKLAAKEVAWTLTLGDGSGIVHQTPTIAENGAIYVGSWDTTAPLDGFCKVLDEGDSARVVWTYPMYAFGSAALTPDGLIVVSGRHETHGWGVFALRDLGDSFEEVWTVLTARQGGTPAISADGRWVYVGSDSDQTFWQIDATDGSVHESLTLDSYVWAASPAISSDGEIFIGEGMTFGNPDPLTEGKLYAFAVGADDRIETLCSLALDAGHLNGGIGAVRTTAAGLTRIYVPANGQSANNANLIAVEFDPDGVCDDPDDPMLRIVWSKSIGPKAFTFPAAVVTHDAVIYVGGPADHSLHAIRDTGSSARRLWSIALPEITRVDGWEAGNQRGQKEIVPGPDGTLYWLAVDGYLYAIKGWPTGDLDGNGRLNSTDLTWLKKLIPAMQLGGPILRPLADYQILFPEIDATAVGDLNGNGVLDDGDVTLLRGFLTAP